MLHNITLIIEYIVKHCNKVSFQELLNCVDYLFENNECGLDHKHIITGIKF